MRVLPRTKASPAFTSEVLRSIRRDDIAEIRRVPFVFRLAAGFAMAVVVVALVNVAVLQHARRERMAELRAEQQKIEAELAAVKEIASDGFPLEGGRLDVVGGRTVAVLVYRAGRHVVSVYMWPERAGLGEFSQRAEGFNVRHWTEEGLVVTCISDLSADELERFEHRWRAQ